MHNLKCANLPVLLILKRLEFLEFIQSCPQLLLRHDAFSAPFIFALSFFLPILLSKIQNGIYLGLRVWFVCNPVLSLMSEQDETELVALKNGFKNIQNNSRIKIDKGTFGDRDIFVSNLFSNVNIVSFCLKKKQSECMRSHPALKTIASSVMQLTADMVSKSFAKLTLDSKFFIVSDRSSSSFFTSAQNRCAIIKTCIRRVWGRLTKQV